MSDLAKMHFIIVFAFMMLCGSGRADPIEFGGRRFQLPVPAGMCTLSEQRHKEQLDFARQLNSAQKLLLLIVPSDRLPLYDPGSSAPANTSLLFDTAEWDALLDAKRELLRASNNPASTTVAIKQGMQKELEALNAARAKGQRYPATGPELRNLTVAGERNDRVFITFINRFQRPFDRGPVDQYGVSGFVVVAPYIFKFSIFSYVKSENELLAVTEREIDALSRMVL